MEIKDWLSIPDYNDGAIVYGSSYPLVAVNSSRFVGPGLSANGTYVITVCRTYLRYYLVLDAYQAHGRMSFYLIGTVTRCYSDIAQALFPVHRCL